MGDPDLTAWYIGFGIGAACVLAVVVAVALMLQRSSDIGAQLVAVLDGLATIRKNTAAVPVVREINADMRELNAALTDTTELLRRLLGGAG